MVGSTASTKERSCIFISRILIGPQLNNNLISLGIRDEAKEALHEYDRTLEDILDVAEEPGLGNGGLGRLAACYMESLATLKVPATGYGIRYKYGIFKQLIKDNQQVEITDNWLHGEWPWELCQPDESVFVGFGGRVENYVSDHNHYRCRWVPDEQVVAVPYDVLQLGIELTVAIGLDFGEQMLQMYLTSMHLILETILVQ